MTERTFKASDETLSEALDFVTEEMENNGCSMKTVMQVTVCVEEMYVNVAHYAYDGEDGDVTVSVDISDGMLTVTLSDSGKPFDPLAKEDPDISLSAEERGIGGLGIFMVKKSMDEVGYVRENGKNVFTMKKAV